MSARSTIRWSRCASGGAEAAEETWASEKEAQEFAKIRNPCYTFPIRRIGPVWSRLARRLAAEQEGENFSYFFRRNPLKSPDSEKQKKANESNFIFACLHQLLLACGYFAAGRERAHSRRSGGSRHA
jgi:hypothetical protein